MCARSNDELFDELVELFVAEANEHLTDLNQKILELERGSEGAPQTRLIEEILRHAHTLKGAAAAVDREDIGLLAHHLESVIQQMGTGRLTADPETLDPIYRTLDAIRKLTAPNEMDPVGEGEVAELVRILESFAAEEPGLTPVPSSPALEQPNEPSLSPQ